MNDYAIKSYAYNKEVRIYVATSTNLVEEARKIHQTWPTATAAFGRTLTVSAMMGLMYKEEETITVRIKGNGPIGSMLVEANAKGEVRGEIQNPFVYIKYENGPKKGKLNVGAAVGSGFLHVTKDLKMKDYFTSSSELQSGEIGDDFTYYFVLSEQVPSSVGVGVLVDTDQHVLSAGGYILQLMPEVKEETIQTIENIIATIKPMSTLIQEGKAPEDILNLLASGTEQILEKHPISYSCHCSKDGFARSLSALDEKTLHELIHEDGQAEIECHFCHKKYLFSKSELETIQQSRKK
ncbi:MAG: Hsp33 family molecular chaperone HslO [Acholeplasmataceae bacterium]|jgi:molecular chaperone Hsp33|nr:Hsp33 family molecular chaperone HslO [Acholeplasmataceae bacterium]